MKCLNLLLIFVQSFISFVKEGWSLMLSFIRRKPLRTILRENTFANQQLAKYLHGIGSYKRIRIVFYEKTIVRSRYGRYFVMMSMPTPENVITGYIGKIAVKDRGTRGKEIIDACAIAPNPSILPADIIIYRAHLLTFTNATTKSAKNAAWKIVYGDLKILLFAFQIAANADQPNSITILESGSFKIKGVGKKQRQVFGLTNGVEPGTIDLVGNLIKGRCFHIWYISYDGGKTYVIFDTTFESVISKTGLTVGQTIYFQHQYITPQGKDNGPLQTLFITVT
jgi:hypothetical protein